MLKGATLIKEAYTNTYHNCHNSLEKREEEIQRRRRTSS
jgi:hypothetical protein